MSYHLRPLKARGYKIHSQNDEDGIIDAIFQDIPPQSRYFVEFGIGPNWKDPTNSNGIEGNCVLLRNNGWRGLFMDGGNHPAEYNIQKEFITALNINSLLRKYQVPQNVDIISIDVDGQDFWIWLACYFRPELYIVEYNPNFRQIWQSQTIEWDLQNRWDASKYYGASLGGLIKLGYDKGYKLVHANGTNAFFMRTDLLANSEGFRDEDLNVSLDQHGVDWLQRRWVVI